MTMLSLPALFVLLVALVPFATAGIIMDSAGGNFKTSTIPASAQTRSLVTVISSPGTTPALVDANEILELDDNQRLICRGATLSGATDAERTSLAACSLIAKAIVLDGITVGDIEAGLQNSRHARTLTALFKTRVKLQDVAVSKQTLVLAVIGEEDYDEKDVQKAVKAIYDAVAVERKNAANFGDVYTVKVVSASNAQEVCLESVSTDRRRAACSLSSPHTSYLILSFFYTKGSFHSIRHG